MAATVDSDDEKDVIENNDVVPVATTSELQLQNEYDHRSEQTNIAHEPDTSSKDCTVGPKKRNNTTISESCQRPQRAMVSPDIRYAIYSVRMKKDK